jgi:hypothetical protein
MDTIPYNDMDYTPYLRLPDESNVDYYRRLWLSDLWDKIPLSDFNVPNECIRKLQSTKFYIWTASREQLAALANSLERKLMNRNLNKDDYVSIKTYCRRIYKRKNLYCPAVSYTLPSRSRRPMSPGFRPSTLHVSSGEENEEYIIIQITEGS